MRPWLAPTLFGPLLSCWGYISLGSLLFGVAALSGDRFDSWLIAMVWGSAFGSMLSVISVVADVVLLKLKLRQLPTGGRAWVSSMLTPFGVFFSLMLPIWPDPDSVLAVVITVIGPMFVSPFVLRLAFAQRP
ncbi:MAG: hypothetical protein AB7P00_25200 [Sandaracinaceae bacterium]